MINMAKQKHICGLCNQEFESEKEYLEHICDVTKHTPKEPEHFIAPKPQKEK